ncbi:DUF192 domain-containing protein [Zeaxanthinibacter enoshimensis]|uniref:DUF192 domain-containing protein n=1 Tax=Zeaxanthinibacter enoshimensis TaxID=392009 RepID=A0A4R6TLS4_9FLAO|nr:DUF192 domain-containing protein [Zeaxanthinibacter enoshimensis]TDQ29111.1 hypothetical protein CLV82_2562 [Zeaxanthinibacter enoshimensis]
MVRGLILLLVLCLALSCKEEPKAKVVSKTISFTKEGELQVYRNSSDSLIGNFDIEIADNEYETQTGLMYRASMEKDRGMLFIFPDERIHSFYMKNTQIPLDILYLTSDMKVASIKENAEPYNETSISSGVPVQYVLEINAGLSQELGIEAGDSIAFRKTAP